MVKHIVMFKLAEKNPANMEKAVNALKSLEGKIEALRSLEIGIDFTEGERSYDIVLTTHFDDRDGFKAYGPHPNHLPVAETLRSLCSSSVVVDYEIS
ncbi:stress responsive protein [Candidatus Nitromaritima sp. SCGC AAA799-A02]|nr:stress responsive protein [Candidatus Nitromaritima sp. SCGC AAA799-A02]KMP12370.1 stress responsive protein [Candidatus Nitromaritima sp. SCGC AAA799-C22]